jgi:ubiquinone/menaquinone biosynthesis C-methylase UbiE
MPEVLDNTFDAVVSLSAMEHIPYESSQVALNEIKRVLKPFARWSVTTSGTEKAKTWFHEPSQGNCFSSTDLEKIFGAKPARNITKVSKLRLFKGKSCQILF